MESTIKPFVQKSLAVNYTLMEVLNERLGLPKGALAEQHPLEEPSGSESRCIKNPPKPEGISEEQAAIGAHTDFGSLVSNATLLASELSSMLTCCGPVIFAQPPWRAPSDGSRH